MEIFDKYVDKETLLDDIENFGDPYIWGVTTKAQAHEGIVSNNHQHRFVIDRNGYGKTSISEDGSGNGHWHMINDFKIEPDGTHSHKIVKKNIKGTCSLNQVLDADAQLNAVDVAPSIF